MQLLDSQVRGGEYGSFAAHFDVSGDRRYAGIFQLLEQPSKDRVSIIGTLANVLAVRELPDLPLPGKVINVATDISIRRTHGSSTQVVHLEPVGEQFQETMWGTAGYSTEIQNRLGKMVRRMGFRPSVNPNEVIPFCLGATQFDQAGSLVSSVLLRDYPGTPEHNHARVITKINSASEEKNAPTTGDSYAEARYGRRVIDTTPYIFMSLDLATLPFASQVKEPQDERQLTVNSQIQTGILYPGSRLDDFNVIRPDNRTLEETTLEIKRPLLAAGLDVGPGLFVLENAEVPHVEETDDSFFAEIDQMEDGRQLRITSSLGAFTIPKSFDTARLRTALSF
jgi:hypothetical protein